MKPKEKLPPPEKYLFVSPEQLYIDIDNRIKLYPSDHVDYIKSIDQMKELRIKK
jgi:hypothetical protein